MEHEESEPTKLFFRPISILYFIIIFLLTLFLLPFLLLVGSLFVKALGLPPLFTFAIFLLSLIGSHVNIPLLEVTSDEPILTFEKIDFFGVSWFIPELRRRKVLVAVNLGGAVIPTIVSIYLLTVVVPMKAYPIFMAYSQILLAFLIVTFAVHAVATPVKGLGIATPAVFPPMIAALTSVMLYCLNPSVNPFITAYVSGTLGTLVGADLLNLNKVSKLGAPIVSIGGAGTFDGIYLAGLMAVVLVFILV